MAKIPIKASLNILEKFFKILIEIKIFGTSPEKVLYPNIELSCGSRPNFNSFL